MRKVSPNLDRVDGLDTVLEVPVPEVDDEESACRRRRARRVRWLMCGAMDHAQHREGSPPSCADVQLVLNLAGAPLVPQPVVPWKAMAGQDIKDDLLVVSRAKYIVEQYVAAAGGEAAMAAASSMFAMGKVRMWATKDTRSRSKGLGGAVAGGFVVWQKAPETWCVEMVVAGGTKMSAGSDGTVAWRQTPWLPPHAAGGPPRPLRRCVQGLDPKTTAGLFSRAEFAGEKRIDDEDCFVLRVDAEPAALLERRNDETEVLLHGVWGYFSQRTGILIRLEDSQLVRLRDRDRTNAGERVHWETRMESTIGDYLPVDGVNIAHAGRTVVTVSQFESAADGEHAAAAARGKILSSTSMEETWRIEEVCFNVPALFTDCFLPPGGKVLAPIPDQHQTREQLTGDDRSLATATGGNGDHNTQDMLVTNPIRHQNTEDIAAAAADDVKASVGDGGVRAAVAKKVLLPVPAMASLGWFGNAKIVAVEDAADELQD